MLSPLFFGYLATGMYNLFYQQVCGTVDVSLSRKNQHMMIFTTHIFYKLGTNIYFETSSCKENTKEKKKGLGGGGGESTTRYEHPVYELLTMYTSCKDYIT